MIAAALTRRFPWTAYWLALAAIVILACLPLISVLVASTIAEAQGQLLAAAVVLGWFMLVTLPLGLVVGLAWVVALVVHRLLWRRRTSQ
jgi:hypothetical protein